MKRYLTTLATCSICVFISCIAYGQNADEEAIKKAAWTETDAYYRRDFATWNATWVNDEKITRTFVSKNGVFTLTGARENDSIMRSDMSINRAPIPAKFKNDNFLIRTHGNMAWLEYDQTVTMGDNPTSSQTREYRVLIKDNGNWKLANQLTIDPGSFTASNAQSVGDKGTLETQGTQKVSKNNGQGTRKDE
jgi:SnoaL-like domain